MSTYDDNVAQIDRAFSAEGLAQITDITFEGRSTAGRIGVAWAFEDLRFWGTLTVNGDGVPTGFICDTYPRGSRHCWYRPKSTHGHSHRVSRDRDLSGLLAVLVKASDNGDAVLAAIEGKARERAERAAQLQSDKAKALISLASDLLGPRASAAIQENSTETLAKFYDAVQNSAL